jgi:uncharacterized repeat protein (TIGR03806 family)
VVFSPDEGGLPSIDPAFFDCAHASLPGVELDSPEVIAEGERPLTAGEIAGLCTPAGTSANFEAAEVNCPTLSGYNLLADAMEPRTGANGGIHYELTTRLFTDYTAKYRFIYVPQGKQAAYASRESLDFPVGTIIAKTFTMPNDFLNPAAGEEIIETRLLIHRKDGWTALPYIWRQDRSDADLAVAGGTRSVSWIHSDGTTRGTEYGIPDASACKTCHGMARPETGSGRNMETVINVIGPKARFLNRDNVYDGKSVNQLVYIAQQVALVGLPEDPASIDTAPDWEDTAVKPAARPPPKPGLVPGFSVSLRRWGVILVGCSPNGRIRRSGNFLGDQQGQHREGGKAEGQQDAVDDGDQQGPDDGAQGARTINPPQADSQIDHHDQEQRRVDVQAQALEAHAHQVQRVEKAVVME